MLDESKIKSQADRIFSPFPSMGKKFEWRRRVAVCVANGYVEHKPFWHISYDVGFARGHMGYAPVNVFGSAQFPGGDPRFTWRSAGVFAQENLSSELFVKWEFRPGILLGSALAAAALSVLAAFIKLVA